MNILSNIKTTLSNIRARQVAMIQPWSDNVQPNDTHMAYFVARLLGVKVEHRPMQHNL